MKPKRPSRISEYALAALQRLAEAGLGRVVSIGGALGLLHYVDYRTTKDVDAWWSESATPEERDRVLVEIEEALSPYGETQRRSWGDVVTIDLKPAHGQGFSFQIARRSAQLRPSAPAPWVDLLLDSLPDLLASKMVALIERGAPRDFRDIHAACQSGATRPGECWELWQERQVLTESDSDSRRARVAIETHLERIAKHRPLDEIEDQTRREEARRLRAWFRKEFLRDVPD